MGHVPLAWKKDLTKVTGTLRWVFRAKKTVLSKAVSVSAFNINFGSIWLDMFHRRNEPTVNLNLQRPKCPKRSPTSHPGDIWISNQTTVAELLPASKALGPSPPAAPSVARPEALGSSSSPPPPPAPAPPSVAALSGWSRVVFEAAPGAARRESWWPKWGSPGIDVNLLWRDL